MSYVIPYVLFSVAVFSPVFIVFDLIPSFQSCIKLFSTTASDDILLLTLFTLESGLTLNYSLGISTGFK